MKTREKTFKRTIYPLGFKTTLITLLLLCLFVHLGFWQLSRAELKKTWMQNLENPDLPLLSWSELLNYAQENGSDNKKLGAIRFYLSQIKGHFLPSSEILLDNQTLNGQTGYLVLTPFQPENSQTLILINRGWIPLGADRNILPKIETTKDEVTLIGRINTPASGLILKKEVISSAQWPLRIQSIDFYALSEILQRKLIPFLLELEANSPAVFATKPNNFQFQVNRHLGYALQWFTIALVTLIYYVILYIRQSKLCNTNILKKLPD